MASWLITKLRGLTSTVGVGGGGVLNVLSSVCRLQNGFVIEYFRCNGVE